jgi:trans-aconitate methyltransferase
MYKWNAEDYYKNSANQQRWAREVIAKLDLKGNERVLDIGCGDGKITAEIASYLPNGSVVGVDISQQMIDFALSKFPPGDFPNLSFQRQDAQQLSFNNEFDLIVSFSCLHWIQNHLPVIESIKNSLKPNGRTLLKFGEKSGLDALINGAKKMIVSEKWSKYFQEFTFPFGFYTPDEYKDLLKRIGFKANAVESTPAEMIYEGKEGLKGFIRATWVPLNNRIPEDLLPNFIEELADIYIKNYPPDDAGLVSIPLQRLEVDATKV